MNFEELIKGNIYKTYYENQGHYIFRANNGNDSFLNIDRNNYQKTHGNITPTNGFHQFKLPTEEEIQHFLACEKEGKYIDKPKHFNNYLIY